MKTVTVPGKWNSICTNPIGLRNSEKNKEKNTGQNREDNDKEIQ